MTNSLSSEKHLYAHLYNEKGYHSTALKFDNNTEQIASIIVKTSNCPRIVITDSSDNIVLDTIDGFVDTIYDQTYLKDHLLPILIPMQEGKIKPSKVHILHWGVSDEKNTPSVMLPFLKENFGVEL
jgi:hypothetical protein